MKAGGSRSVGSQLLGVVVATRSNNGPSRGTLCRLHCGRDLVGETVFGLMAGLGPLRKPGCHVLRPMKPGQIFSVNTCPPYSRCDQQGEYERTLS